MVKTRFFTSESVSEGHPDKVCDKISDAILDEMLRNDPNSRCAVECATKNSMIVVMGEVTTEEYVDVQKIARDTLKDIGYTNPKFGIDYEDAAVLVAIQPQSPDISIGVTAGEGLHEEQGAGDQGLMFGFACDETPEYMPLPISLAHKLTKRLADLRKKGIIPSIGPDAKSQVTIEYENDKPKRIEAIVIAQQHLNEIDENDLREAILNEVIKPICKDLMDDETKIHINATGRFVIGGPAGDAGLTGRKIIVDTYGGMGRHGGGAFSGKDPSKVDRSGAYAARYIAKNVVAAGLAKKCEVQLAYAIGVAEPVGIYVDTFGTSKVDEDEINKAVKKIFPVKPADIIKQLDLKKPIYYNTASYGHFGRSEFSWEKLDKVDELKKFFD